MKKTIAVLGGLFVAALALAIIPATREEIHWDWVSHKDTFAGYQSYVKSWPAGRYADVARARLDDQAWINADLTNTVIAYRAYAAEYPKGRHAAAVQARLDEHGWATAESVNTIAAYQTYISTHPQGTFVQQAEMKTAALRSNEVPYEVALRTGTEAALVAFLADYPGHTSEAAAQQALREIRDGRDIVDLLSENKIEVQARGSGISKVVVRLRRLAPNPLTVRIPVGSYFVSANPSAQNMVTTAERKVRLMTAEWQSVSTDAACANRPKRIPGGNDTFTVQRSPHQAELAKLMPVLDKARVEYQTRQAAVWIVTDNASYSDLGVLVASQSGVGGNRVIKEADTARAMRICDEAGIDVTEKAIWKDYRRIASALEAGELKTWLEQMAAVSNKKGFERVIADYTMAIELAPKDAQAYSNRGVMYQKNGEYDRAIADFTKAIEIDPKKAQAYTNRGIVHQVEKKEFDQAIQDYDKAIAIDPKDTRAYANRGTAYEAKGDNDRAIADFRRALAIDDNQFSKDAPGNDKYDRTIADLTKAIERNPKHAQAHTGRGYAYQMKGEFDRAIADYIKAIEMDPKDAQAYTNRGVVFRRKGEYDRAVADFTKAIEIDPKKVQAYTNRGNAYQDKKELDQAIQDYDRAIAIDPKYARAYAGRGSVYEAKGDKDRAIADFRRALAAP